MQMTLRVFAAIGAVIVGIFIVGCGADDEEDSPAPAVKKEPEPAFGVDGDTYRNRRLFKVSNLPIDDWTVKEVTKAVEGENGENFIGWVPLPLSLYTTIYTRGEDFIHARGGLFLRSGVQRGDFPSIDATDFRGGFCQYLAGGICESDPFYLYFH